MSEQKTILVGVANPRTAEHLVRVGIELAKAQSARLAVISVVIVPPGESLSTGAREARGQRRMLRKAAQIAEHEGITAEMLVRAGHAVEDALVEAVAETNAGLLVVGWAPTPRYGQLAESAMWRLSQEPPCDVLSVKPLDMHVRPKKILLPVRGGQHADLAASIAVSLARIWDASVTMLRVIPEFVPDLDAQAEAEAFRAYWEVLYAGVVQARSVVAPRARDYLLQEAANYDLVVMGAAASSRSFPFPFGQLAEDIAEHVSCPIFIAKTERTLTVDDFSGQSTPANRLEDLSEDVSTLVDKWFAANTFHSKEFATLSELVRQKEQQGVTISLVLPTLNEEETIGSIIQCMQDELQKRVPLIDEMIVIDSRSQDRTADIARSYGVPVYVHQDVLPHVGSYSGKGEALWKSLSTTTGDIIAWIDTDIANIHAKFVYGLLGPLLREPRLGYVKGFYRRPLRQGGVLHESSGGRVTELTARPLLNMFYPLLSGLIQPLSGEYAGRREILEQVPFSTGYGVEIGLLIDILERFGLNAIGQVDLEQRIHRNQSLAALSRMSFTIMQTVIGRLESKRHIELVSEVNRSMKAIVHTPEAFHLDVRRIEEFERPPMADLLLATAGS
ncbi:MAG: putative glycosyltransferase [Chloroflexi bacterium]|nr:putative glycosyltransferase [Chloroflexota bacterium]